MKGLLIIAILVNAVGVIVTAATTDYTALILLVGLPLTALSAVGAHFCHRERQPLGAALLGASSLGLLPFGAVGLVAAYSSLQKFKYGFDLTKKKHVPRRIRPRAWTMASIVFGLIALGSLSFSVVLLRTTTMDAVNTPLLVLATSLLAALSGLEAVLLWSNNEEQAMRLGMGLCVTGLAALLLGAFYLHNYFAVALLAVPIYAILLLWQGRRKWEGISTRASRARA